jgi:hypothetical protein
MSHRMRKPGVSQPNDMGKIDQIKSELQQLSMEELRQVRDWLDDFVEDRLQFTPEFEAAIQDSERDMRAGLRPRVRKPFGE